MSVHIDICLQKPYSTLWVIVEAYILLISANTCHWTTQTTRCIYYKGIIATYNMNCVTIYFFTKNRTAPI